MRERILAMKEIWTQDEAAYHGEHVDFDPVLVVAEAGPEAAPADPRRRRRPARARPRDRATATSGCPTATGTGVTRIADLRRRSEREIPVSYFGAEPTRDAVGALEEAGVYRVFFGLPSKGRDVVERALDEAAAAM